VVSAQVYCSTDADNKHPLPGRTTAHASMKAGQLLARFKFQPALTFHYQHLLRSLPMSTTLLLCCYCRPVDANKATMSLGLPEQW